MSAEHHAVCGITIDERDNRPAQRFEAGDVVTTDPATLAALIEQGLVIEVAVEPERKGKRR